jgi:hypothetical protein
MRFLGNFSVGRKGHCVKHGTEYWGLLERGVSAPTGRHHLEWSGGDRPRGGNTAARPTIQQAGKISCVGLNYVDYSIECGFVPPPTPPCSRASIPVLWRTARRSSGRWSRKSWTTKANLSSRMSCHPAAGVCGCADPSEWRDSAERIHPRPPGNGSRTTSYSPRRNSRRRPNFCRQPGSLSSTAACWSTTRANSGAPPPIDAYTGMLPSRAGRRRRLPAGTRLRDSAPQARVDERLSRDPNIIRPVDRVMPTSTT